MEKILLIDDDEDLSSIVKTILNAHGFGVYIHSTSLHVHEIVRDYNPDLILIDILLYGKSGTEICRELKEIHTDLPIILFSGNTSMGEAFEDCNADGFIEKPFELYDLVKKIKLHLEHSYTNNDPLSI